ncbi:YceI family protein [Pedobacter frigiditerrae]|uniref:YceI family protein n=1 Tax=Pedobacter frigiditerrae TaxID=2530452 RepID=A0A4R0MVF8_9SPHI|nr:YceI family protein [Pedobacter frigiditerrae]TCC90182.1 YceI family protein [Pedobacter frigiditerrae]
MKTLLALLFFFLLTSFKTNTSYYRASRWVISENSSLIVNGSTNINKFSCAILQYPKTDTVIVSQDKTNKIMLSGLLNIEVKNFDCNSMMMTKQLRKTLQDDKFPMLRIKFLSLKETPSLDQGKSYIKGNVEIVIAGVTKRFEICYQIKMKNNSLELIGHQPINFSDFNLIPPKKIGKLIQAKDQLIVAFLLKMELVS